MTAGTGTRAFRNVDLGRRFGRPVARGLSLLPLAAPAIVLALASTIHPGYGYAGIYQEPAFSGRTAQEPGVGHLNLRTLEHQLAAKIDHRQKLRRVWVTSGLCELTSAQSASCGFFGSDGSSATIPVYISADGSTFWTPGSASP